AMDADRAGTTGRGDWIELPALEESCHQLVRGVAEQDGARRGRLPEYGGDAGDLADSEIVAQPFRSPRDDHRSRMDPDLRRRRAGSSDPLRQLEGRMDGPAGVILVRLGIAEPGQEVVVQHGVAVPAEAGDDLCGEALELGELLEQLLGIER